MAKIRTRFAPSPTGFVHIGGLRTALYNYLFAKRHAGTFILRIEDTDRTRFVEGATENLIHALEWAGLDPDEGPSNGGDYGPYFQSQRTELYIKYARELLDKGFAYYAFDTPEEIDAMREKARRAGDPPPKYDFNVRMNMRNSLTLSETQVRELLDNDTPFVIRLKIPENRTFQVDDKIRGKVSFSSAQVDDQVLIKSDGYPTYHLANIVDDHLMDITHVIRGEEWLSSVPKHLYLYECFGWQPPVMAHLPLIFNPDKSKMSKRDITSLDDMPAGKVDPDVASYIKKGYEPEALINYIALLGWNPGDGDERQIFSITDLKKEFSLERVNKAAAIFDLKKLDWINAQHISLKDTNELATEIKPQLAEKGIVPESDDYLLKVVELLKTRMQFIDQFVSMGEYFFRDPEQYDPVPVKKRWKDDSVKLILEFIAEISKLEVFDKVGMEQALNSVAERNGAGVGRIIHPIRLAVSGTGVGPGVYDMLEVLGRETVIKRLKKGIEDIPKLKQ